MVGDGIRATKAELSVIEIMVACVILFSQQCRVFNKQLMKTASSVFAGTPLSSGLNPKHSKPGIQVVFFYYSH